MSEISRAGELLSERIRDLRKKRRDAGGSRRTNPTPAEPRQRDGARHDPAKRRHPAAPGDRAGLQGHGSRFCFQQERLAVAPAALVGTSISRHYLAKACLSSKPTLRANLETLVS